MLTLCSPSPEVSDRSRILIRWGWSSQETLDGGFCTRQAGCLSCRSWQDLAVGFLHHYGKDSLEEWASFVIMADYDFPEERGDDAERFLNGLHDIANGWPPSPGVYELAECMSVAKLD